MDNKIKVDIFGVKGQEGDCGCAGGGCGPTQTIDEQVDELKKFLDENSSEVDVEVKFFDVMEDEIEEIDQIKAMTEQGYSLPLTAIEGKMKFYGGISPQMIYDEIANLTQE